MRQNRRPPALASENPADIHPGLHFLQCPIEEISMLRILFGASALLLFAPGAFACDRQTGKVIFEDKFTDDSGGWAFGKNSGLALKAPGATLALPATEEGATWWSLDATFNATQGDFCVEMSFPANAVQLDADIGVVFLATGARKFWTASVYTNGVVALSKLANNQLSSVWTTAAANNLVKTGLTDVNSVRAVVKGGSITVIVNGQTVKSVRAAMPGGDLKFGFMGNYNKRSATPVFFPVHSYKVTAVE
jgi:hypothetical protein